MSVTLEDLMSMIAATNERLNAVVGLASAAPAAIPVAAPVKPRRARTASVATTVPVAQSSSLTGVVIRTARQGYGALVNDGASERWINAPKAGPALFADWKTGQTVTVALDEHNRVVDVATVKAPRAATTPVATPTAPVVTPRAPKASTGGSCEFCGAGHGKDGAEAVSVACIARQFKNDTGKCLLSNALDFAAWLEAAPRRVKAHTSMGSRLIGGADAPSETAAVETAPVALPVSAPVTSTPTAFKVKNATGVFDVTLVAFPKDASKCVIKVHSDLFASPSGLGSWVQLDAAWYSKVAKNAVMNDRLRLTMSNGAVSKVQLLAKESVAKVTGVTPGVKGSGRNEPGVQVTGKRADDTKREARKAGRRAARNAVLAQKAS